MRTFMLGWEFPPFISGGLGTACYGLAKAMDQLGIQITFVLPKVETAQCTGHFKMLGAHGWFESEKLKNIRFRAISSTLQPYIASVAFGRHSGQPRAGHGKTATHSNPGHLRGLDSMENYRGDMYAEVHRYAAKAAEIAATEEFDIIHAHDWMTYPAGIAVARVSHKPLLVQVHSTEFDRSGEHVNQMIYDIERQGMHAASKVIAVSNYTKNIIINRYGVPPEKVEVVYNGVEDNPNGDCVPVRLDANDKIVLYLGRITMQKGPEYFLAAAKKVLEVMDNIKFIMAGDGDMMNQIIELAAQLGIGQKVLFTRFLRGDDVRRAYQMADLYVMPSVSEPFGITPLEALQNKVPVIISKQSGIAEALTHALKVDFWDINEMANKIVAVLRYQPLHRTLCENGHFEAYKFRWEDSSAKVKKIYEDVLASA